MAYIPQRRMTDDQADMRPQLREDIYALPSRRTITRSQSVFIHSAARPQLQEDLFLCITGLPYVPTFATRYNGK